MEDSAVGVANSHEEDFGGVVTSALKLERNEVGVLFIYSM